ncbi:hypothetical protein HQ590_03555, partial [bacterium]|nr:hypothetical protein [bacterium]
LGQPGVALVERAQLEKILAEHQITGSALVDPGQRVQLGQLVPADLLVFLDSIPKLPKPATRVQVTESKTGIVLASAIFENDELLRDQQPALELVRAAIAKRAVPLGERHLLGYLDFRSEESGPMLDGIAAALGTLVITDLARAPHIIVLERDHLQHLRIEKQLTPLEQQLRASAWLLEGGVRRTADTNQLTATISLRSLVGGPPLAGSVVVPANDLSAGRTAIGGLMGTLLRAKVPAPPVLDLTREAAAFSRQASLWAIWGDRIRAIRAAEAAYGLDPTRTNQVLLVGALLRGEPTLREAIRADHLLLDGYRQVQAAPAAGASTNRSLPFFGYRRFIQFAGAEEGNDPQRRRELAELENQVFRVQLGHARQWFDQTGTAYWDAWVQRLAVLPSVFPDEPARQLAFLREAIDVFLKPPARPDWVPPARLQMLLGVPHQLYPIQPGWDAARFGHRESLHQELYAPVFRDLTRHADPFLRFVGWYGVYALPRQFDQGIEARFAMFDLLLNDLPPTHLYRRSRTEGHSPPTYQNDWLLFSTPPLMLLERNCPEEVKRRQIDYYARLYRSLLATGDPVRFDALRRTSGAHIGWLEALANNGRLAAAVEFANELLKLTDAKSGPRDWWEHGDLVRKRDEWEQRLTRAAPAPPPAPAAAAPPAGWEDYDIRRLDLGFKLPKTGRLARSALMLLPQDDHLVCLRPNVQFKFPRFIVDLDVSTHALPGGQIRDRFTVPLRWEIDQSWAHYPYSFFTSAALAPGRVYVGTRRGLLDIPLQSRDWKLITEQDGLPGSMVRALGWYEGTLYLGLGCDPFKCETKDQAVLAAYNPQAKTFTIVAAERAVGGENAWNGVRFFLDDILPDPARGCLWLKDRERGVWKFDPAASAFEQVGPGGGMVVFPGSRYSGAGANILDTFSRGGATLYRPADGAERRLPPKIGDHPIVDQTVSAVFDGDRVLGAGEGTRFEPSRVPETKRLLYLLVPGRAPAALERAPDGQLFPGAVQLVVTGAGIVAVAEDGQALLIRRKGGQP